MKSPCALEILSQPASVQSGVGETVQFTVDANSAEPIEYQWQTDVGFGWQNLTNAGQYSGVNTATLTVSNVSSANNNQIFRCQVKISDDCITNTQTAILEIGTSGLAGDSNDSILVFPNPSENTFNISAPEIIESVQVMDVFGRVIFEASPSNNLLQIDATLWSSGTYILVIDGSVQHRLVKK